MWTGTFILAQGGDDSGGQLIYVIAVIVLSLAGFLADKVKSAMAKREEQQRQRSPRPTDEPATREVRPVPRPQPPARSRESEFPRPRRSSPPAQESPRSHRPRPPARPPVPAEHPPKAKPAVPRPRSFEEARDPWKEILRKIQPSAQAPMPQSVPPPPSVPPAAPPSADRKLVVSIQGKGRDEPTTVAAIGTLIETKAIGKTVARPRQTASLFRGMTTAELQRAFILKEVLDKPLALREDVFNTAW